MVEGVERPDRSLADFIAPKGVAADCIGLFAVTPGIRLAPGYPARPDHTVKRDLCRGKDFNHPRQGPREARDRARE